MNAIQKDIVEKTITYVKEQLAEAEAGHDWQHIQRVLKNAKTISAKEEADEFTVTLASLLHDIADAKFHNGNEALGPELTLSFLKNFDLDESLVDEVVFIVKHISFKSETIPRDKKSKAFQIVQDADRLDALGAIGIARTFHYGGYKNRLLYDENVPPKTEQTKSAYKASTAPTINHFYEKLLLLKDQMNTPTGKQLAEKRHDFMLRFLDEFFEDCGVQKW